LVDNSTNIPETTKANTALVVCLIIGAILIPLTRLPQFLGGHMVPDGDECIVGMMAKHTLDGKLFPVFLYGQSYGLCTLEAGTAALFFRLFGVSAVPLKAAMLLLWGIGWLFLVLAVRRLADARAACIAAIVMATCPAWGPWSMKAWGGYVTAFLLTNVCLWMLGGLYRDGRARVPTWATMGVLAGLIHLSKPMWLLGLAPFIALLILKRRRLLDVVLLAVGAGSVVALFQWLGTTGPQDFWSPPMFRHPDILTALRLLPYRVWVHLSGSYLMEHRYRAGMFTNVSATLWSAALLVCAALQIRAIRAGERFSVGQACSAGIIGILAFTLPVNHILFGFRYILPLTGFLVILMAVEISRFLAAPGRRRTVVLGPVVILIACGMASMVELGRVSFSGSSAHGRDAEAAATDNLIRYMLDNDIHYVYSVDPMLTWTIIFASQERILARWVSRTDRYAAYPRAVDRALMKGKGVAIVGRVRPNGLYSIELKRFDEELKKAGCDGPTPQVIGDVYFVFPNPSITFLKALRFGPLRFALNTS
jgi:hypothetical protein